MKRLVAVWLTAAALVTATTAYAEDIVLAQPGPDGVLAPAFNMNAQAFIPGSRAIVAAGPGPVAGVFSAATGERIVELAGIHGGRVYAVTYAAAFGRLATASTEGRLIFWDRATGEGLSQVVFDRAIGWPTAGIAVAADGSVLMIAGDSGIQIFTDRDTSRLLDISAIDLVLRAELAESGSHIVVVGSRASGPEPNAPYVQTVHVYDVAADTWATGPSSRQVRARIVADGRIMVATDDGRIVAFAPGDVDTVTELRQASPENRGDDFAISRDGNRVLGLPLAFNRNGPTVFRLWDAAAGTTVDVTGTLPGPAMGVDLSDNGDRLLIAMHDNATRLIRTEIWTIAEHM